MTHREFWQDTFEFYDGHPERRAFGEDETCLYLTDDGRKCAIGRFIPDGHAAQRETDVSVASLFDLHPELRHLPAFRGLEIDFLALVQGWHDTDCSAGAQRAIEIWLDENEPVGAKS